MLRDFSFWRTTAVAVLALTVLSCGRREAELKTFFFHADAAIENGEVYVFGTYDFASHTASVTAPKALPRLKAPRDGGPVEQRDDEIVFGCSLAWAEYSQEQKGVLYRFEIVREGERFIVTGKIPVVDVSEVKVP